MTTTREEAAAPSPNTLSTRYSSTSSAETASDHESHDSGVHWVRPPLGPLSAFDLFEDRLVFFEERHNRVVVVDRSGESDGDSVKTAYVVPAEYSFSKYYWATLHFVDRRTLLCLLKHHGSRLFSLVTFSLDDTTKTCKMLCEVLTDIAIEGYQIWSQRSGDCKFCYSFTNRHVGKKTKKKMRLMKSVSDRALFRDQIMQVMEAQSAATESKSLQPVTAHRRTTSTDSERVNHTAETPRLPPPKSQTEVVMLEAAVSLPSGVITQRVLSVGRRSVRLRVSTSSKRRSLGDSLRFKQMNRLSPSASPSPCSSASPVLPFLLRGHAVFLDKDHPTQAMVVPVRPGDSNGVLGAVAAWIRKSTVSRRVDPCCVAVEGEGPRGGEGTVWSDFHVENDAAFVAVQDTPTDQVRLWKLTAGPATTQPPPATGTFRRPSQTAPSALSLRWESLSSLPCDELLAVSEMRLSLSPDHKTCIRGSRTSSDDSQPPSQFCMTFDQMRLTV